MSEFYINTTEAGKIPSKIKSTKTSLLRSGNRVKNINRILSGYSDDGLGRIIYNLNDIQKSIMNQAAKATSLENALKYIISAYENYENSICGDADKSAGSFDDVDKKGSDKSWFDNLVDWIKSFFQVEESPETISKKMEKTKDKYMQKQIFDLLKTDEFSKKAWNKASVEERERILSQFLSQLMLIMGVTVNSKIDFTTLQGEENTRGAYTDDDNLIMINPDYLTESDSYSIMQTMIHEMRHAYQHAAVENPENFQVSRETIDRWRENFQPGNYKSTSEGYTYDEYAAQPIEYDAKNFAKQYSDVFGINPEYRGSW